MISTHERMRPPRSQTLHSSTYHYRHDCTTPPFCETSPAARSLLRSLLRSFKRKKNCQGRCGHVQCPICKLYLAWQCIPLRRNQDLELDSLHASKPVRLRAAKQDSMRAALWTSLECIRGSGHQTHHCCHGGSQISCFSPESGNNWPRHSDLHDSMGALPLEGTSGGAFALGAGFANVCA